jgi:hypothetical protein
MPYVLSHTGIARQPKWALMPGLVRDAFILGERGRPISSSLNIYISFPNLLLNSSTARGATATAKVSMASRGSTTRLSIYEVSSIFTS